MEWAPSTPMLRVWLANWRRAQEARVAKYVQPGGNWDRCRHRGTDRPFASQEASLHQAEHRGAEEGPLQTTPACWNAKRSTATLVRGHSWTVTSSRLPKTTHVDLTLLRGLLVKPDRVAKVLATFACIEYPGNMAIPGPQEDHYTYAGEIPWSEHFASALRGARGRALRDIRSAFAAHDGRRWLPGIQVEVPVYSWCWESRHSPLNQVGNITVPSPSLCDVLRLSGRGGEWNLCDAHGKMASLYREFRAPRRHVFVSPAVPTGGPDDKISGPHPSNTPVASFGVNVGLSTVQRRPNTKDFTNCGLLIDTSTAALRVTRHKARSISCKVRP